MTCFLKPLPLMLLRFLHSGAHLISMHLYHQVQIRPVEMTKEADILVAAVGHPNCVTADMVKPGATVIDVGINRVEGKTVGDVDYDAVLEVAGAITPVPGGVGSVTTTMVIENIIAAGEKVVAGD